MYSLFFITSVALLCLVGGAPGGFIIGGEEAEKGAWPFMVSVEVEIPGWGPFRHQCGGALLTPRWVLSAAHCYDASFEMRVRLGQTQIDGGDAEQTIAVDQLVEHPEWDPMGDGIPNDIALLHLAVGADLSNPFIGTIVLPEEGEDFVQYAFCFITGWGRFDNDLMDPSPVLKQLQTNILRNEECSDRYEGYELDTILPTHMCTNNPQGQGGCNMDSGGPAHCDRSGEGDWVVGGVLSWGGDPCGAYPSVYTRVSQYLEWIRQHVPDV